MINVTMKITITMTNNQPSRLSHTPRWTIHAPPGSVEDADEVVSKAFHWHVEVIPRLGAGAMAGFEFGSGMFSNSQLPEDNAATLRAQESWGAAKSRFEGML